MGFRAKASAEEGGEPHSEGAGSMAANSALIRMLSFRTLCDTSASRLSRSRLRVSRFIYSMACRIYLARDTLRA